MFSDKKEQGGKKNNGKVVVGYDLGKTVSQISFSFLSEGEVETISCVAGTEQYNIPTVLCKRNGVNQWFYGKEALKYAKEEDGILVEDLLNLAERGEEVLVEGESYDPAALLTLFVKRSLSLLNMRLSLNQIEALMFTVEELTPRMVEVLSKVVAGLQLKTEHLFFQSHLESFYYYTLYQPEDLWRHDVYIFEYSSHLKCFCLERNYKTTPQVVFITETEYPEMQRLSFPEKEEDRQQQKEYLDKKFLSVAQEELNGKNVSTVYLLGDGFKNSWAKDSLRFLCRNRRVFQGNNLYSKGACYSVQERLDDQKSQTMIFLGKDKLKTNVGMEVSRQGEDSYLAILDGGENWYECQKQWDVILREGNMIRLKLTPLNGRNVRYVEMVLDGLPERERNNTRLRMEAVMLNEKTLQIQIKDMGFGEFVPASNLCFSQQIDLDLGGR